MNLFTCPCCGYRVFKDEPGSHEICPICRWEDDVAQLRFPNLLGANSLSLIDAQKMCPVDLKHIEKYAKDLEWIPINEDTKIEFLVSGVDYGETYPSDLTKLYYWKK